MKKAYYLFFAAAFSVLTACETKNEPTTPTDKKITLSTTIVKEVQTKSPTLDQNGAGNFNKGDVFTLFVISKNKQSNHFNYEVGTTQLYWKNVTVADNGSNVYFSACYPIQETVDGKFYFDLNKAEEKDLLLARTTDVAYGSENPISLTFHHAMHRLTIKYTVDKDIDAGSLQTKCSAKSTCSVDATEGTINTTDSTTGSFSEQGKEVEFIIVPQKASDVTLEITVGSISQTLTIDKLKPELDELEGGKQLNVELTVKNGKIEIGNVTIEGWGNQGTISGEIII